MNFSEFIYNRFYKEHKEGTCKNPSRVKLGGLIFLIAIPFVGSLLALGMYIESRFKE